MLPSSSRPGPHREPVVGNLELDRLMTRLPLDLGVATAYKNQHRNAFASRRPQHRERNLELRDASDSRAKTRLHDRGPTLPGPAPIECRRSGPISINLDT